MKLRKVIAILLTLIMTTSIIAACQSDDNGDGSTSDKTTSSSNESNDKKELKEVRWIGVDNEPNGMQEVLTAINEKLIKDGLDIQFKPEFFPRDIRDQKITAMFNAGESAELIHIMENAGSSTQYIAKEMILPIDDLLAEYGKDLLANIDETIWSGCKVNGETYTVPAFWKVGTYPGAGGETGKYEIDTFALYDYNGGTLDMPKTIEELKDFMYWKKEHDGTDSYYWPSMERNVMLHRGFDSWPFFVDYSTEIIYMSKEGEIKPWFETDEFRQEAEFNREMYLNDMLHAEILSMPYEERNRLRDNGKFLLDGGFSEEIKKERAELVKSGTYPDYYGEPPSILCPDKPILQVEPVLNVNAVLATSKNPEAGIQFLNWLYSDFDNHALLMYGIEGKHYTANLEQGTYVPMKDSSGLSLYNFPIWQMGFANLRLIDESGAANAADYDKWLESEKKYALVVPENLVAMPNLAFRFDPSPVAAQMANCIAEFKAVMYPIKYGVLSYDEAYADAAQRMYDAGIEKVIGEYKKQFEEYKEVNNIPDGLIYVN